MKIILAPPLSRTVLWSFTNYYAWKEFLPHEKYMQIITSIPINPGDEIYVSVWMGRPKEMPDLSGDGVFWIFNVTTKKQTMINTSRIWMDARW